MAARTARKNGRWRLRNGTVKTIKRGQRIPAGAVPAALEKHIKRKKTTSRRRKSKAQGGATVSACGCPSCGARKGSKCKTPSGNPTSLHKARKSKAAKLRASGPKRKNPGRRRKPSGSGASGMSRSCPSCKARKGSKCKTPRRKPTAMHKARKRRTR